MKSLKNNNYQFRTKKGLNADIVIEISQKKNEPVWMTEFRLKSLKIFKEKSLPNWGPNLNELNINDIYYYIKPVNQEHSWDNIPDKIKTTFDKLGIPKAEQKFLSGVGAQFESEIIYQNLKEKWKKAGVIFLSTDTALQEYPDILKEYFSTIIPPTDNKFAALNSAVWSGGSFVYVPKGVYIDMPLQAYFRINSASMGQFERTLIIAQEGSYVHYVEGCSAPIYKSNSLHSAVVEIFVHKNAHVRYTTVQNWSNNVYNLVTKRAIAYENSKMEWVDGNFGSKITMKYPSIILKESGAKGQIISLAVASKGQHQDAGGKVIHLASNTTSNIISKSISKLGGRTTYRGLLKVIKGASGVKSKVKCDTLMLDKLSRSDAYPTVDINESNVDVGHEASISKISELQLFYLMCRGFDQSIANALIINGFIDCFVKELPMEYAVEINRLITMEMEGSIG